MPDAGAFNIRQAYVQHMNLSSVEQTQAHGCLFFILSVQLVLPATYLLAGFSSGGRTSEQPPPTMWLPSSGGPGCTNTTPCCASSATGDGGGVDLAPAVRHTLG